MKVIKLYTNNGIKTMEFKFQSPGFYYIAEKKWVTISATGRTFTIKDVPILAYDEEIKSSSIVIDLMHLTREQINSAYNNEGKILIVFSSSGEPIRMFYGEKISLINDQGDLDYFQIDEKDLWIFKMNYLILSKNK